jgi:hypothetical protein
VSLDVTGTVGRPEARVDELLHAGWPRFSDGERARRRAALVQAAAELGCDLVIAYGAERAGTAVPWLCGWPVTREAALVVDARSGEDLLLVDFHNHVPLATELADDCEVRWAGPSTADTLAEELARAGERTSAGWGSSGRCRSGCTPVSSGQPAAWRRWARPTRGCAW